MATHSSILSWRIPQTRGAWWATVHRVAELDTTEATKHAHAIEAKVLSYKNITNITQQNLVEVEDIPDKPSLWAPNICIQPPSKHVPLTYSKADSLSASPQTFSSSQKTASPFAHTSYPIHQQVLHTHLLKYIQNPTSRHLVPASSISHFDY